MVGAGGGGLNHGSLGVVEGVGTNHVLRQNAMLQVMSTIAATVPV